MENNHLDEYLMPLSQDESEIIIYSLIESTRKSANFKESEDMIGESFDRIAKLVQKLTSKAIKRKSIQKIYSKKIVIKLSKSEFNTFLSAFSRLLKKPEVVFEPFEYKNYSRNEVFALIRNITEQISG
jgi:hypothetical protein